MGGVHGGFVLIVGDGGMVRRVFGAGFVGSERGGVGREGGGGVAELGEEGFEVARFRHGAGAGENDGFERLLGGFVEVKAEFFVIDAGGVGLGEEEVAARAVEPLAGIVSRIAGGHGAMNISRACYAVIHPGRG